jgi:DNA-directed RNA polymerase subunit E'
MFYLVEVEDYIRVEPKLFGMSTADAVKEQLNETYSNYQDKDIGFVIAVLDVISIQEGVIIPEDGAVYHNSRFKLIVFKPELQELVYGNIEEITNFGAFINMGLSKGMIHISQTMEDFVSFSKTGALSGKKTKRTLNKGDSCIARVVAISYKSGEPKVGLTMRQPGIGRLDWIKADKDKNKKDAVKQAKSEEKAAKGKK